MKHLSILTRRLRGLVLVLSLLLAGLAPAAAQVSVSIGINVPVYPTLVRVPGYPVYYAPRLDANYFFYDGLYWIFQGDAWYASAWYDGPWTWVDPDRVPLFILRVPVRYYRAPPVYFGGWRRDAPPRWGRHWGDDWQRRHRDWDRWNRRAVPAPAPLPIYQRRYSGDRYPDVARQHELQQRNYRHAPRDPLVRQRAEAPRPPRDARPAVRDPRPMAPRDARPEPRRVQVPPAPAERRPNGSPDSRAHRPQPAPRPAAVPQRRPEPPAARHVPAGPPARAEAAPPSRDAPRDAQRGAGRRHEPRGDREARDDRGPPHGRP